jgi:cytidine deaminase
MHHVGRCRELIRMINTLNLETKVMVDEDKVYKLKDLLPEMYITKNTQE